MRSRPFLGVAFLIGIALGVFALTVTVAGAWPWSDQARERNGNNMSAWERYRHGLDRQGQARRAQEHPRPPTRYDRPLPPEPDYSHRWRR